MDDIGCKSSSCVKGGLGKFIGGSKRDGYSNHAT